MNILGNKAVNRLIPFHYQMHITFGCHGNNLNFKWKDTYQNVHSLLNLKVMKTHSR